RHRWEVLAIRGVAVDGELPAERRARARIALPEDAVAAAILAVAVPDHHEVARAVGAHLGIALVGRGVVVHLEPPAERRARAREALAGDACAVAVAVAQPHHHEVPRPVGGDLGTVRTIGGVAIDLELAGERGTGAREASADDTTTRADLAVALP